MHLFLANIPACPVALLPNVRLLLDRDAAIRSKYLTLKKERKEQNFVKLLFKCYKFCRKSSKLKKLGAEGLKGILFSGNKESIQSINE